MPGRIVDGARWVASERLEPGARYRIHAVAKERRRQHREDLHPVDPQALTLAQQTYASVAPLQGRDGRRRHARGDRQLLTSR